MASPSTRQQLIDFCLRKLGDPVIEINVDEDQIQDKVDDALQYYREFHSDATKKIYLKHLVTSTDVTNEYIPISSDIILGFLLGTGLAAVIAFYFQSNEIDKKADEE